MNRPARPRMRVDWQQYFRDFCQLHGQPLTSVDESRLLFPDGWAYSATSHKGPEFPPPADPREKWQLILEYWRLHRLAVRRELTRAREELTEVLAVVAHRSAGLTVVTVTRDPDTGESQRTSRPLNVEEFRGQVQLLEKDLADAEAKVRDCELELRLLRMPRPESELTQVSEGPPT